MMDAVSEVWNIDDVDDGGSSQRAAQKGTDMKKTERLCWVAMVGRVQLATFYATEENAQAKAKTIAKGYGHRTFWARAVQA